MWNRFVPRHLSCIFFISVSFLKAFGVIHSSSGFERWADFYADPFSLRILLMGSLLATRTVCKGFDFVGFPWLHRKIPEDSTVCNPTTTPAEGELWIFVSPSCFRRFDFGSNVNVHFEKTHWHSTTNWLREYVDTCIRLERNRLCRLRRLEDLTAAIVPKTETLACKYFKCDSKKFKCCTQLMLSCDYTESRTGKGEMLAPEMIWSWWTDSNFIAAVCFIFRVSCLRNTCILLISPLQARW